MTQDLDSQLDKSSRLAWRKFLATEAGTKGLLYAHTQIPVIRAGDANAIVFAAGKVEGFRDGISVFMHEITKLEPDKEIKTEND